MILLASGMQCTLFNGYQVWQPFETCDHQTPKFLFL
jgi:hypothetical protein